MADRSADERRRLVLPAVLFFGALIGLVAISALASGLGDDDPPGVTTTTVACDPDDSECLESRSETERPGIIPEPGSGGRPEQAGDPGGAAQLALFGVLVLGLVTIVALVVISARRARRTSEDGPDGA